MYCSYRKVNLDKSSQILVLKLVLSFDISNKTQLFRCMQTLKLDWLQHAAMICMNLFVCGDRCLLHDYIFNRKLVYVCVCCMRYFEYQNVPHHKQCGYWWKIGLSYLTMCIMIAYIYAKEDGFCGKFVLAQRVTMSVNADNLFS